MYHERKAEVGYFLAREIGSNITPRVQLEPIGTDIEQARFLDRECQDFQLNARHWISIYHSSDLVYPSEIRAEAQIGVAQHLTNLGDFKQAKEILTAERYDPVSEIENGPERSFFEARRHEKLAWIADYQMGYHRAIEEINQSRRNLGSIDASKYEEKHRDLSSTLIHFEGRANFGLANQGVEQKHTLTMALNFFKNDLQRYLNLRERGTPRSAGEAHNHRWLARCEILAGNWTEAEREVEETGKLFEEASSGREDGGTAHYYLVKGYFILQDRRLPRPKLDLAEHYFHEAARIWREVKYPMGEANAQLGLAKTYWEMKRPDKMVSSFSNSYKIKPEAAFRAFFGA